MLYLTQKRHPGALTPRKSVLKGQYGTIGGLECLTDRLPDHHCDMLYGSAIYTPARLSVFSSPMPLFVQCRAGGKWRKPVPLLEAVFHMRLYDANCLVLVRDHPPLFGITML